MKKILLLVSMAFVTLGINAQTWAEPTVPTEASDPISGHQYRIRNVAAAATNEDADAYLAGGASWYSWATSTVLTNADNALSFTLTETKDEEGNSTGWTIARTSDGKYTFMSGASPASQTNLGEMHVDMASQGHNYWNISKQENGNYHIGIIASDNVYGENGTTADFYDAAKCWGWDQTEESAYPSAVYANVTPGDQYACDWQFVDMSVYNARVELYNTLVSSLDYTVDNSAASAVYNNEASTLDEIQEANTALSNAIKIAKVYAVLDGASEDNPKDGTSLIENPDFETGNISGWECTFVSGTTATNIGYQGASYTNGSVTISKFIEAWSANNTTFRFNGRTYATIGDAELQQTLPSLPAGKYLLTCDANAVQQYESTANPVTGVQLFAKDLSEGGLDNYTTVATGNGLPEHFELIFYSTGGDVVLGLRTSDCTANWIAADNFTLTYYGQVTEDPEYLKLKDAITKCEETYPDIEEVRANADLKTAYSEALDAAKGATEDYATYKTALEAAAAELATSVEEYSTAKASLETIENYADKATNSGWDDLADELADYHDALNDKYEEGTLSSEDLSGIDDKVYDMVVDYLSQTGNVKEGDDVTILLKNPGFDKNFSNWTVDATKATPAWGGMNLENDNGTGAKLSELNSGNAEVYHATFDISQTIKNMPRGLYTLSCKAFERDDNAAGVDAELYAVLPDGTEQTVKVKDLYSETSPDVLYQNGTSTWDTSLAYGEGYVPNTMCGANVYFAAGYYKNQFDIIMAADGDLTVGIRTASAGDWVLFDDFQIVYNGQKAGVFDEAIQKLIDEAGALGDNGIISQETQNQIDDAITTGENALGGDADAATAAMTTLNEAIAAGKESIALTEELKLEYTTISEYRMGEIESSDTQLQTILDEVSGKIEDSEFESDLEVYTYIIGMQGYFTQYVQCDHLDATEENPADITPVIYNTKGVDLVTTEASTNGWEAKPGTANVDGNSFELYNQTYDWHQTIYGLAPGYYRLHVQGFYRNGWADDVANAVNGNKYATGDTISVAEDGTVVLDSAAYVLEPLARLYVECGDEPVAETGLASIMKDNDAYNAIQQEGYKETINGTETYLINSMAQAAVAFDGDLYHNTLQFELKADEEGDVAQTVIGLRKSVAKTGDWTIFTNWTLEYLGTAAPSEDPTTKIANVEVISNNSAIYDLTGRRVSKAQKGIYIINGKKVIK